MNLQFEIIIREHADQDSIIEIAGGFAINRDDGQGTEIATVLKFASGDHRGDSLRFFERGSGKMVRQVEFADRDLDVDAEVVFAAEDLDDLATRLLCSRGPIRNFYVYDKPFEIGPVAVASRLFA
jgi:hypothetical protein